MPLDGDKLDELISGLIDGQLSPAERQLIEELADSDAKLRSRIEALRRQSSDLRAVSAALTGRAAGSAARKPSHAMAQVVIEAARRQAREQGFSADHYILREEILREEPSLREAPQVELARAGRPGWRWPAKPLAAVAGVLAAAALLLLAVNLMRPAASPSLQLAENHSQSESPPTLPADSAAPAGNLVDQAAADDSAADYVGQFGQFAYVLVADVQITKKALGSNAVEEVLSAAGIPVAPPVLANAGILKALENSKMIVTPQSPHPAEMYVHVIRADMQDIDAALQAIWQDELRFPRVSLNMAIDARANLVREILKGMGQRFSPSDSFAFSLSVGDRQRPSMQPSPLSSSDSQSTHHSPSDAAMRPSPFPGSDSGVHYIASSQRALGWEGTNPGAQANSSSLSTILLVLHVVD